MAEKPFEVIRGVPLPPGGSDFQLEPERQPPWITCILIVLAINCLGGIIGAAVLLVGKFSPPPAAPPTAPMVADATREFLGQTLSDPLRTLESATDPATIAWVEGQQTLVQQDLLNAPVYKNWEQWYYGAHDERPNEMLSIVSTPSRSWWHYADTDAQRQFRYGTDFSDPTGGTLAWTFDPSAENSTPGSMWPSPDGEQLLVALMSNVTTQRATLGRLTTNTATMRETWSIWNSSRVVWLPDSSGFWFERADETTNSTQIVLQVGTGQPQLSESLTQQEARLLGGSSDHQWLIFSTQDEDDQQTLYVRPNTADLDSPLTLLAISAMEFVNGEVPGAGDPHAYLLVEVGEGNYAEAGAGKFQLVAAPLDGTPATVLVKELPGQPAFLSVGAQALGVILRVQDHWQIARYDLQGTPLNPIDLEPEWEVYPATYPCSGHTTRFGMTGLTSTWRMVDFDPDTGQLTELSANPGTLRFQQGELLSDYAPASDGAMLPITRVQAPGAPGPRPTMLYVDGGADSRTDLGGVYLYAPWVDAGGLWVSAAVRGSRDADKAWRGNGTLMEREQTVRDVLAVAHHLVDNGLTTPEQLILIGRSHGAWLVSQAALTEPSLFAGVIAISPVTDLTLLTDHSTYSWWELEFGSKQDPLTLTDAPALSPYFQIERHADLPAFYLATAQDDTYIEPWQCYKFAARLQAHMQTLTQPRPVYCYIAQTGGASLLTGATEDWYLFNSLLTFAGEQTGLTPRF